jgi:4'-phosphopantetheinyl transferase EntD
MKSQQIKSQAYIFYKHQSIIGIIPILPDSEQLLSQLMQKEWYLPFLEKMSESRKCEWLSVRILLKELLGKEKEIRYNPSGKPYLSDFSHYISISHTKGYAAVILDQGKEVSIDIEKISPRIENLHTYFVNEEEEKSLSKKNRQIHLLLHWSAKESIFKRLNCENIAFKSQLHIRPFEPLIRQWSEFQACETRTEKREEYTVNYFVSEDYVLTYI